MSGFGWDIWTRQPGPTQIGTPRLNNGLTYNAIKYTPYVLTKNKVNVTFGPLINWVHGQYVRGKTQCAKSQESDVQLLKA